MKIFIFQVLILLQFVTATLYAQNLSNAEYFVDADPGLGNAVPVTVSPGDTVIKTFSLDLGSLSPGWHQLNIRVKDQTGRWGAPIIRTFFAFDPLRHLFIPKSLPIVKAEYFYDTDPGPGNGTPITLNRGDTVHIDRFFKIAGLPPGPHRVFIRTLNENGRWSLYKDLSFNVDTSTCNMPVANFTYDTVTYGTPVTFTNLTINTVPGTVYKWDINNDGTIEYTTRDIVHTFPSPGIYPVRLRVENNTTCVASAIKEVVTGPVPSSAILITGPTTFCAGDSVILTSSNTPPGYSYEWSTGATTRAITVKSSGNYYVWTKDIHGISSKSVNVSITVHGP